MHVVVIGGIGHVVVIVPQLVVCVLPSVSVIVSCVLYVPALLYVCVVLLVCVLLVVPSLNVHLCVYVPVPPFMLLFIVAVTGVVPLVGVILHVPLIGFLTIIVPQFVVFVFPFVSVIVSVGLYVPEFWYVCVVEYKLFDVVPSLKFHWYV